MVSADATDATVVRGTAIDAGRVSVGQYFVRFAPNISDCAYVATNGHTGVGTAPGGGSSVEGASASDPTTTVAVRHRTSSGSSVDYATGAATGFQIAVIC